MSGSQHDVWAVGAGYELYVGRWSRLVAPEFLKWIAVPAGQNWLDVGCGTGALTQSILDTASPALVVSVDSSDGFVAHARAHVTDPRADFRKGDAQALPVGDGEFDAVVSGLVVNFIPDQAKAALDMRRAARTDGTVAAYVWDYAGEMQLMRHFWDAAVSLRPAARELDEANRFPVCRPDALRDLFTSAGLRNVAVTAIDVPTAFRNFDDYWSPFLGGQGPAPGYCMSLPEPDRVALRDRIRDSLSPERDGSIRLLARAWAVKGIR